MNESRRPAWPVASIGGREYSIKLDHTALWDYEQATGRTITQLIKDFDSQKGEAAMGIGDVVALAWAGTGGPDGEYSAREFGRLIKPEEFVALGQAVGEAITVSFGGPKNPPGEPEAADQTMSSAGTGKKSRK